MRDEINDDAHTDLVFLVLYIDHPSHDRQWGFECDFDYHENLDHHIHVWLHCCVFRDCQIDHLGDHLLVGGHPVDVGSYYSWGCRYQCFLRLRRLYCEEVVRGRDDDCRRDHLGLEIWIGDHVGLIFRRHKRNQSAVVLVVGLGHHVAKLVCGLRMVVHHFCNHRVVVEDSDRFDDFGDCHSYHILARFHFGPIGLDPCLHRLLWEVVGLVFVLGAALNQIRVMTLG